MNNNVDQFGDGMLIEYLENENYYYILGYYELKSPLVHQISKRTELNNTPHTRLRVPNQKIISDIMAGVNNRVKEEKWFTEHQEPNQERFAEFETFLVKALSKFEPNQNSKIGLLGELYVLDQLLKNRNDLEARTIINAWTGHSSKSRDFILGECCVEVKTTTNSHSLHKINNLNQVDPTDDDGGVTKLYMASLGITEDSAGDSIVSLTESIIQNINDADLKDGDRQSKEIRR